MTAAVESTWRVELTCRKVRQYSCDSARAAMQHCIPIPDDAGRQTQISVVLVARTPARSGEKRCVTVPGAGERRAALLSRRRESAGKRSADRLTGSKTPAD
jgi:hypothetical protein